MAHQPCIQLLRSIVLMCVVITNVRLEEMSTNISNDYEDSSTEIQTGKPLSNVSTILQEEETIEAMIHGILTQLRNRNAMKVPGFDIPDPMPIEDFDTSVNQGMTKADVQLWNVTIEGLSEFIVDRVTAHLGSLYVGIGMNLTHLRTKGEYDLVGKFSFFRFTGKGAFYMNIGHAYVSGNVYLNATDDGGLEVEDIKLDITVSDLKLNFENLLGGGVMSSVTNTIINTLSTVIFDSVKPTILQELQNTVKMVLNEQFQNIPPQAVLDHNSSPLDIVFANTATQIRQNNLDPFALPDQHQSFKKRVLFVNVHGNVHMDNGYLRGLSSLHRTGDITMSFKENILEVSAELGFNRLEGGYKWRAKFMGISRKGGVHFFVNGVQLIFNATQTNAKGSHPIITGLEIKQIQLVGVDVDGLGSLDFLLEFFSNFMTNVFKKQFSRILETNIKKNIQDNLDQVRLPF